MSTDTWSEYISSTYAASLSTTADPDQYCPNAVTVTPRSPISSMAPSPNTTKTTTSSTIKPTPNPYASISPTYGPYAKSGRGGAGNYTWQNYPSPASTSTNPHSSLHGDPEQGIEMEEHSSLSERQRRAKEVELREVADAMERKKDAVAAEQDGAGGRLVMSGRGGAGNYLGSSTSSSSAAQQDIESDGLDASLKARSQSSSGGGQRVGYYGRGGAGNFRTFEVPRTEEQERRGQDEARRAEEVRREVERSVGAEIGRPEGVVVREGRERT